MLNIIQKRKYFYFMSISLVILSILAVSVWGLKLGIDFTGGSLMEVGFPGDKTPGADQIQSAISDLNPESLTVQPSENSVILRYQATSDDLNDQAFAKIKEAYPDAQKLRVDFIGSSFSKELARKSIWAIILSIIGIAIYVALAFRKVSYPVKSWKYGTGAVIALAHDVMITIGAFAFLGKYYNVEVGVPFVAALLTILGYSVNDTIVVYDRTRENLIRSSVKENFEDTVNRSTNETLARSINTNLTVIMVLVAIIFLGGESIKFFALALLIGVTFGTYSSIFVASALLVTSNKIQAKNR